MGAKQSKRNWPEGDRPLQAIGTPHRTFNGSIRPVANLHRQNSAPESSILCGGSEHLACRCLVGNPSCIVRGRTGAADWDAAAVGVGNRVDRPAALDIQPQPQQMPPALRFLVVHETGARVQNDTVVQ